jgi:uncharacterized protein GlcG (DUF336 family)
LGQGCGEDSEPPPRLCPSLASGKRPGEPLALSPDVLAQQHAAYGVAHVVTEFAPHGLGVGLVPCAQEAAPNAGAAGPWYRRLVTHEQALAAIRATLETAPAPVSVAVVDDHGELVACLAMDGAARDTLENARRKAYTAARSDATSTRALAEKVHSAPSELASFDPQFSFFHGGVAAFSAGHRVGAVGVSGLPGTEDERLAIAAIGAAGLQSS